MKINYFNFLKERVPGFKGIFVSLFVASPVKQVNTSDRRVRSTAMHFPRAEIFPSRVDNNLIRYQINL